MEEERLQQEAELDVKVNEEEVTTQTPIFNIGIQLEACLTSRFGSDYHCRCCLPIKEIQ